MTKSVFLLGAGGSKAAGFPLANDLLSFINEFLSESRNTIDIAFKNEFNEFSDFLSRSYPSLSSNVELLLTYIDLAILNTSVGIFKGHPLLNRVTLNALTAYLF